jgi:aspartate racemase
MKKPKVVGVLGGYGPYATADFYRLILNATPAEKDWDHLHVIIDANPKIPSRARAYLFNEESPIKYMIEGVDRLKNAGADFFVCPCNSAHYFLQQQEEFSLPFLDMTEVVVDEILKSKKNKIGIIGSEVTVGGEVYDKPLNKKGMEAIHVDDLSKVRKVIEFGKHNKGLAEGRVLLLELIEELKNKGAEGIIYACTELPIVLPSEEVDFLIFDTSKILAQNVINY